jgi:uncharacterized protein
MGLGDARENEKDPVSQKEAEQGFFDSRLLVVPDARHSQAEPRLHALGMTIGGRLSQVSSALRVKRTRIQVISVRNAHRTKRQIYESPN